MFARLMIISALTLMTGAAAALGNEGGGGGSIVTCPGHSSPELTDLYELRTKRPDLAAKLERLRGLDEQQAGEYVAARFADFLSDNFISGPGPERAHREARELMFKLYRERNFGNPEDPKDSGRLVLQPGCVESRVAVNYGFDPYTASGFSTKNFTVVEKHWNAMKPFDRFGLIAHELFYTITEGRIAIDDFDPLLTKSKVSQDVRPLMALILAGEAGNVRWIYPNAHEAFPKVVRRKMECWAGTDKVRRTNSTWDRINFDLFRSPPGYYGPSQLSITDMWGIVTYLPNLAATDVDMNKLKLSGSLLTAPANMPETKAYPVYEEDLSTSPIGWSRTRTEVSFHVVQGNEQQHSVPVLFMKVVRNDVVDGVPRPTVLMDGEINCNEDPDERASRLLREFALAQSQAKFALCTNPAARITAEERRRALDFAVRTLQNLVRMDSDFVSPMAATLLKKLEPINEKAQANSGDVIDSGETCPFLGSPKN
jgi:hypothetical protein